MYVGHKNTNLQNFPPPFCKFVSGHINFDISFHLPPQRAVARHGEVPHAAAAAAAAARRCGRLCLTPPLPDAPLRRRRRLCRTPPLPAALLRRRRRRRCCCRTPPLPLLPPPPPNPDVPSNLRLSSPPRCRTRWSANIVISRQPPPTKMRQGGGGKKRCNNQIEATAAAGCNNKHWRSMAEMDDGL
jgi:hypothetical protein